jgi:hypothetical protein
MAVEIFFAAASAISAATQVMIAQQERLDRLAALEAGRVAYNSSQWNITSNTTLQNVERRIPAPIMETMANNARRCWQRLEHFISDDKYSPEERTTAHKRARECVCTELQEMLNYLGTLPEELQAWWNACGCPNPQ